MLPPDPASFVQIGVSMTPGWTVLTRIPSDSTAHSLDGVFLSVKYAVPAMRRAGGGSIIITSSTAGLRGSAGLAGYCATKGGVRLFAKAVAMDEALRRGYREIRLYTHQTMVENQLLYTSIGYEETGRGTEAGYDRVFMRKQLRRSFQRRI